VTDLDLAVIGNCQIGALLDRSARVVWACVPRFDGDPAFCSLLNGDGEAEAGYYDVELEGCTRSEQRYLPNTAVVETLLHDANGGGVKIVDFAPRFERHRRFFRPTMLIRIVTPLAGRPHVRMRLRPLGAYGAVRPTLTHGSNHIRYVLPGMTLRLTTDVSITAMLEERAFVLDHAVALVLGPDGGDGGGRSDARRGLELRRVAIVQRECDVLVLEQRAGMRGDPTLEQRPRRRERGRVLRVTHEPGRRASLRAVNAGHRQA